MGGVSVGVIVTSGVGVEEGDILVGVAVGVFVGVGVIVGVGVDVGLGVGLAGINGLLVGSFFAVVGVFSNFSVGEGSSDEVGVAVGGSFLVSLYTPSPYPGPIVTITINSENIKNKIMAISRLYLRINVNTRSFTYMILSDQFVL